MITRFFKDYNKLFAEELNKNYKVKKIIGEISPKDIHLLHYAIQYTWVRLLYEHFPTVLNFGKYFYVFTKSQILLDKFEINNYHKMRKENKRKPSEHPDRVKKWTKHLGRTN